MGGFGIYARYLICCVLMFAVLRGVDFDQLGRLFAGLKYSYVLLILLVLAAQAVLKAYKWYILLRAEGVDLPPFRILQLDYVSTFLSLFFASGISVELFKAYGISRSATTSRVAASSILADRWVSLFALLCQAAAGTLLFHDLITSKRLVHLSVLAPAVMIAVTLVLMGPRPRALLARRWTRLDFHGIRSKLLSMRDSLARYGKRDSNIITVFCLSLAIQAGRILTYFLAALALGSPLPLSYFFAYVPLIMIIVLLPVSFGGIGIREGSFVYFFGGLGISSATAFAISFLVSISVIFTVLPGGLVYAYKGLAVDRAGDKGNRVRP